MPEVLNSKNRIEYIDLAKGSCIILVVAYHIQKAYSIFTPIDEYIGVFRMPLYFFLSGLFFKSYGGFLQFLKKKVNRLLIPFLFFYFLSVAIQFAVSIKNGQPLDWSLCYLFIVDKYFFNVPIWFLWCLFVLNMIFYGVFQISSKFKDKQHIAISILSVLIGVFGYEMAVNRINLPAFIDTACTALPFFTVGYLLRVKSKFLYPNRTDKYLILIVAALIALTVLLTTGIVNYRANRYEMPFWGIYGGGLCGLLSIILISKMLKRVPFVSYLGRYSIIILTTHALIMDYLIMAVNSIVHNNILAFLTSLVLLLSSYAVIIPFMKKYMGYVTAQKDLIK